MAAESPPTSYPGIRPDVEIEASQMGLPLPFVVRASKTPALRSLARLLGQVYSAEPAARPGIFAAAESAVADAELVSRSARRSLESAREAFGLDVVLPASGDANPPTPSPPATDDDAYTLDELDELTRPGDDDADA